MIYLDTFKTENLGGGVKLCVSAEHTFGTDGFLLSYFAAPKKNDTVCDLGSGCGIIPFLWYSGAVSAPPKKVYAVDIQEKAVQQLKKSAELSGLDGKIFPVHADLNRLKGVLPFGEFDLVTCNPPYKAGNTGIVSENEYDKIARHETLCDFDSICKTAYKLLRYSGRLCICMLSERLCDVLYYMRVNNIEPKTVRFVHNKKDSAPYLVLVEGKRSSKPFLRVMPPLILREDNNSTSQEMRKIYGNYGYIED